MARSRVTQADLAVGLGISQAAVSRRLTGMVDFTVSELDAVASVLGVPTASLLPAALARSAS